jgi:hypothetical protein
MYYASVRMSVCLSLFHCLIFQPYEAYDIIAVCYILMRPLSLLDNGKSCVLRISVVSYAVRILSTFLFCLNREANPATRLIPEGYG